MESAFYPTKYFLGANSQMGFISLFNKIYTPEENWFAYILKGGPGTGKSTLMKNVANYALSNNIKTEMIYCSSDPDSLDAVIFDDLKCCIIDGTAPHTVDPKFPGAVDTIVNLCECWDTDILIKNKNEIVDLTEKNSSYHKRAKCYLAACAQIESDTNAIINKNINTTKLLKYSNNLSKRILFNKNHKKHGKEKVRFLSGITPKGCVIFDETVTALCKDIYIIDDEYSLIGTMIISSLKKSATTNGFDVITCYCPMNPQSKIDSLIIPEKETAFLISNSYHKFSNLNATKKINAKRFIKNDSLNNRKKRLNFNSRVKKELLQETFLNLKKAKDVHDEIEKLYAEAMDYNKVNSITKSLIKNIF